MNRQTRHRAAPWAVWLILLGLVVAAPLAAGAQEPPPRPALDEPPPEGGPPDMDRPDTARLFLVHKMRKQLQLTDAQTLQVLDLLEEMEAERKNHHRTAREIHTRIENLLAGEKTADTEFKAAVADFQRERDRFEGTLKKLEDALLQVLTPRQQAQFVQLRNRLMEGPGGQQGKGKRRGQGGPPRP